MGMVSPSISHHEAMEQVQIEEQARKIDSLRCQLQKGKLRLDEAEKLLKQKNAEIREQQSQLQKVYTFNSEISNQIRELEQDDSDTGEEKDPTGMNVLAAIQDRRLLYEIL